MKSKREINKYAPWEEEEKEKRKPERGGGIPAHTSQKSRVRSKPKSVDQEFLDMYIMAREKERMEKYGKTLGRRQRAIASSWKEVKSLMYNLKKKLPQVNKEGIEELVEGEKKTKNKKKKSHRNMKKMDWDY